MKTLKRIPDYLLIILMVVFMIISTTLSKCSSIQSDSFNTKTNTTQIQFDSITPISDTMYCLE